MQRVEVSIPSSLIFERVVRASTAEIGAAVGLSTDRIEDLKLAVSEAVTNAIEHGNRKEITKLVAVVFSLEPDKLEVKIADQGPGVETIDFSQKIVKEENLDRDYLRGFGMYLISALVDDCEVSSSPDGTVLTLRIYHTPERTVSHE